MVGRDSSLVRLIDAGRELLEDRRAASPGSSARWKTTIDVLSWPVGAGIPSGATAHEAGLVLGVVLDVGGEDVETVDLGGQRRADGGGRGPSAASATARAASAVELAACVLDAREVLPQEAAALGGGDGDRHDRLDVGERRRRPGRAG